MTSKNKTHKVNENTKVTLTYGQLKRLVKESIVKEMSEAPAKPDEMVAAFAKHFHFAPRQVKISKMRAPFGCIYVNVMDEEWLICGSYNSAYNAAMDSIEDLLDDIGLEATNFDNIGGIESFVDINWFIEALEESDRFYLDDIKSEDGRYEEEFGDKDEDEALEELKHNWEDDPVEYFIDNFGRDEFNRTVKEHNLVDLRKLTDAIIRYDGIEAQLSSYDGKEIDLGNDIYAYRRN